MVDSWKFGVTIKYGGIGETTRWFPNKRSRQNWINSEKANRNVTSVKKKER